ncbi:hypothetical protein A3F02_01375 [Candidatus Curtissbacteria bacterium RIFCSPHIGHO2_12_FULL_38_9b]|uniref:Phage holin family protein n=2 Tax=Candidatus Curtissiibacteriota TaxID=1752717 RepID=A0A1F5GTU9_9BACT|nr:MAG: hypothetical protein A3F02_01375 [Candidatus Curtissbacteria bacterium RIFCSPHIGHO2_12_FULL_38_9b]OGD95932.1 MAG: hypothetical protein A3A48_03815 [Candidatus Curtissbacteria bacterium RIFCSPLOWO2_01_FULL_37_9]
MFKTLANWVVSAITIFIVATYVPGFEVDSFLTALIVALVLGIVNAFIKPIITILTLPITILTLGLFAFVINALLIWGISAIVAGFTITGFVPALIGAIALWLINLIIHFVIFPIKAA